MGKWSITILHITESMLIESSTFLYIKRGPIKNIYFILRKNEMSRFILYFKSCTYSVHVQRPQILNAWPWALAHGQEFNIWISLIKMGSIAFVFSIVNGIFATSLKTVRFSDKGWVVGRRGVVHTIGFFFYVNEIQKVNKLCTFNYIFDICQ